MAMRSEKQSKVVKKDRFTRASAEELEDVLESSKAEEFEVPVYVLE